MHTGPRVYLDNAATSFPKPPGVAEAVDRFLRTSGGSAGRGNYREAREAGTIVAACRAELAALVGAPSADHVIFTLNCSDALNLAIRGMVEPALIRGKSAHVVTTDMDHNSVLRPVNALAARWGERMTQTRIAGDPRTGRIDPEDVRAAIRPETRLVAIAHASNVAGTIQPIREIGQICRSTAVPFLVDVAQSLGHVPVDFEDDAIDLMAFPGHKGLLGPLGTGGLIMRPGLERALATVREGGTGSRSELDTQPEFLPDKYEPGSHNLPGIAGLLEAVRWIRARTVDAIRAHEIELVEAFFSTLREPTGETVAGIRILGPMDPSHRVGVISVVVDGVSPATVSAHLEDRFGMLTRPGMHCAPLAHRTFGRDPQTVGQASMGATRFSFGPFNTVDQIARSARALATIAAEQAYGRVGASTEPAR